MKQNAVVCQPGPALFFLIFRFEYLISGPKSYRDFRETGPSLRRGGGPWVGEVTRSSGVKKTTRLHATTLAVPGCTFSRLLNY